MPIIKLPGPVGKWTKQLIRLGGKVVNTFWFYPLDHGFGLKLRKIDGVWRGCVYSWHSMVHHELEGTENGLLSECKARTCEAGARYFNTLAGVARTAKR